MLGNKYKYPLAMCILSLSKEKIQKKFMRKAFVIYQRLKKKMRGESKNVKIFLAIYRHTAIRAEMSKNCI